MDFIVMTVRGRKDLTFKCLETLSDTLGAEEIVTALYLVDASEPDLLVETYEIFGKYLNVPIVLVPRPGYGISKGWNTGIDRVRDLNPVPDQTNIWLLNNDVVFTKSYWLSELRDRLNVPGTGLVGSSAMSVFGLSFATGGIWGFKLSVGLEVAEDGKILDEELNYCCQDVDLSVRIPKAGYVVTHVPDVELGSNPKMQHLVSQTVYSNEGEQAVLEKRRPEFRRLINKHGRKDGKDEYEGV